MPDVVASGFNVNDTASELEPLQYLFAPLGETRPVSLFNETVWNTGIKVSSDDSEQRALLGSRPRRRLNLRNTALDRDEKFHLQSLLAKMSTRRFLCPLYSDRSTLTSQSASGTAILNCDTTLRRFHTGARVVVYQAPLGVGVYQSFEVGVISSLTSSSITLTGNLATTFPSGSHVAPLIECEIVPQVNQQNEWFTESNSNFLGLEIAGKSALPALVAPGTNPSGFATYNSLPILDIDVARTKFGRQTGVFRQSKLYQSARGGSIPWTFGARPRQTEICPLEFLDRTSAWDWLRFFDSRGGACYPFYMMSPSLTFSVLTVVFTEIVILRAGLVAAELQELFPLIGIRLVDGTIHVREATYVEDSQYISIEFTSIGTLTALTLDRAAPFSLYRMQDDVNNEEWLTPEILKSELRAVELPLEQTVEMADFTRVETLPLDGAFNVLACEEPPTPLNFTFDQYADDVDDPPLDPYPPGTADPVVGSSGVSAQYTAFVPEPDPVIFPIVWAIGSATVSPGVFAARYSIVSLLWAEGALAAIPATATLDSVEIRFFGTWAPISPITTLGVRVQMALIMDDGATIEFAKLFTSTPGSGGTPSIFWGTTMNSNSPSTFEATHEFVFDTGTNWDSNWTLQPTFVGPIGGGPGGVALPNLTTDVVRGVGSGRLGLWFRLNTTAGDPGDGTDGGIINVNIEMTVNYTDAGKPGQIVLPSKV